MSVEHVRALLDQIIIATRALTAMQPRREAIAATYSNAIQLVLWVGMSRTEAHRLIDHAYNTPMSGSPPPPPTRQEIEEDREHQKRLDRIDQRKHPLAVALGQWLILLAGGADACASPLFADTLDSLRIVLDPARKDIDAAKMRVELADGLTQFARALRAGPQ